MIRRPPRSTPLYSSAASDVYKRQLMANEIFPFIKGHPKILASPYEFQRHPKTGMQFSELMPELSKVSEEICMIHSMHTDQFNHAPAQMFIYTGSPRFGRPSMGSWLTWGLGSANQNLPSYVVLVSGGKTPSSGKSVWGSGFLPSVHQGVQLSLIHISEPTRRS